MAKRTEKEESEVEEKSSADASRAEDEEESGTEESDDSEERDAAEAAGDESAEDDEEDSDEDDSDEEDSDEEEPKKAASSASKSASKSSASKTTTAAEDDSDDEESDDEESDDEEVGEKHSLAAREGNEEEGDEEVVLPTQLGTQRYIFSAYFAGGMLLAYVLGRAIHGIWSHYANRDFFVNALPTLAAIPDESKQTYATVVAGVIALFFVVRTYRKPDVKVWTEEVTTEITKVKWPTRKEVTNATIVVIAASAIATAYLFLLDRLWAFVTGLVYGAGT